jgi:hypothetical protein
MVAATPHVDDLGFTLCSETSSSLCGLQHDGASEAESNEDAYPVEPAEKEGRRIDGLEREFPMMELRLIAHQFIAWPDLTLFVYDSGRAVAWSDGIASTTRLSMDHVDEIRRILLDVGQLGGLALLSSGDYDQKAGGMVVTVRHGPSYSCIVIPMDIGDREDAASHVKGFRDKVLRLVQGLELDDWVDCRRVGLGLLHAFEGKDG